MRTLTAAVCGLLVLVAGLTAPVLLARADSCPEQPALTPENIFISPDTVPVGVRYTQYAYLTVAILDPCSRIDAVVVTVDNPVGERTLDVPELPDLAAARRRAPATPDPDGYRYWGLDLALTPADLFLTEAGTWSTQVTAHDNDTTPDSVVSGPSFDVVRAARLTANAFPERAKRGATVTVTGALTRANWESARYLGHRNRRLELQFRRPSGPYTTLGTVTTGDDGTVRSTVTATRDGCYRYVFRGTSTTQAVKAAGDCIDVH